MDLLGQSDWRVLDDFLPCDEAMALEEMVSTAQYRAHRFKFANELVVKPGIFEVDRDEIDDAKLLAALAAVERRIGGVAAVKLQRNVGGAFPAHFDNAGPPSRRQITAILYLNNWNPGDGGELVLMPFLQKPVEVPPLLNRLVVFRSDLILHAVWPWRSSNRPRYAISFWFDADPDDNATQETVLTKDHLRFSDWDAAARFFQSSPLQRILSRAVYDEEYRDTLAACGFDDLLFHNILQAHIANVDAIRSKLRPLVDELRRRKKKVS